GQSREFDILGRTSRTDGWTSAALTPAFSASPEWRATGHSAELVTAFVRRTTWISASEKDPEWTLWKTSTKALISTGDSAMAPATLGMNPKVFFRSRRAGFDFSGADSTL